MRRLPPNSQLLESVAGLFGLTEGSDLHTGYITAQGNESGLMGFTQFALLNGASSAAVPAESAPRTRLVFSQVANNVAVERGRYFLTGLALLNPGAAAASFTMTVVNGQGQAIATKVFTLPPNHKISRFLSAAEPNAAFFDPDITLANGYILVTSNSGLMGFELFFTNDLLQLTAVPAQ